jgi:hypothetical protein
MCQKSGGVGYLHLSCVFFIEKERISNLSILSTRAKKSPIIYKRLSDLRLRCTSLRKSLDLFGIACIIPQQAAIWRKLANDSLEDTEVSSESR